MSAKCQADFAVRLVTSLADLLDELNSMTVLMDWLTWTV